MTVKIVANDKGTPPGKLADAELLFTDGPLAGLKLLGFAVWERKTGTGREQQYRCCDLCPRRQCPAPV